MTWYLVLPVVMHLHAAASMPQISVRIEMPSQAICEQIRDLNTPGPDGVPGPQCWELEKKP